MLKTDGLEAQLIPDHPGTWRLWDELRLFVRIIWNIRTFYRARPSVVTPRNTEVHFKQTRSDVHSAITS